MKRLSLLLSLCVCAFGSTVQDTIKNPDGTTATGTVGISLLTPTADGSSTYAKFAGTYTLVQLAAGITLAANDTLTPAGTTYRAQFSTGSGRSQQTWQESWLIPTSASPLKVSAIRAAQVPSLAYVLQPQQIANNGATEGQALVKHGNSVAWANAVAGSAAWGGITGGDPMQQSDLAALFGAKLTTPSGSGIVAVTSGTPGLVAGTSTDCVRVDGTSGPCGTGTVGGYGQTWDSLSANGTTWDAL